MDAVDVVEREHERARPRPQLAAQVREAGPYALAAQAQFERRDQRGRELSRIVVVVGQRNRPKRAVVALRPLREQARLAVARRRRDHHERHLACLRQAPQLARPHDEVVSDAARRERRSHFDGGVSHRAALP